MIFRLGKSEVSNEKEQMVLPSASLVRVFVYEGEMGFGSDDGAGEPGNALERPKPGNLHSFARIRTYQGLLTAHFLFSFGFCLDWSADSEQIWYDQLCEICAGNWVRRVPLYCTGK